MSLASLRIRLALWIAPELLRPVEAVAEAAARTTALPDLCTRTEQVIRLGELWLAHAGTRSFRAACGLPERGEVIPGSHFRCRDITGEMYAASTMQTRWRAICSRPPSDMRPKSFEQFLAFFAAHWPADLPWPADIPRPALQREAA
jgi:hypothetical protein